MNSSENHKEQIMDGKPGSTIHTFGELFDKVKCANRICKLPRAAKVRKSNVEVLLAEQILDATITVFGNGLIIYSRDDHETVTTVDRCASPVYTFSAGNVEIKEGVGVVGCKCRIIRKKNGAILLSTIPKEAFIKYPWYVPIVITCEARLDNNQELRERYRINFHFNDDNYAGDFDSSRDSVEDFFFL